MKRTVKFIYWAVMAVLFLALWYRQYQMNQLNRIEITN
jgi:hypothetical protein